MNEQTQILAKALSTLPVQILETDFGARGFHARLVLESGDAIPEVAQVLLTLEYFIGFVTACHTDPDIQLLYQFARYDVNHRIMVQCPADKNNRVPTLCHIFPGANWHERETRDFFGVTFTDHPNMDPFILDVSDRDLKPLLKTEAALKSADVISGQGDQA